MAFRRRTKSYPLFSQEFVIHNHADIGFCLVLCVLIGLMFEVTAKTAFLFILPQYNISVPTAGRILNKPKKPLGGLPACAPPEEIPRQLQYICLYLVHIAGAYLLNLSRLGLILLLLQYSTEFLFHTARLFYFADENNEKLFSAWAAVFGVTRLFILTLAVLAIGFGLARMENQAFDPEKGNFNTLFCRLCVLLLVCAAQAWLMWRFIHSQLRHWREYWNEQSAKRRVPATPRLPARLIKRESGYHENGVVKAENGTSPRTKKLKSP
ncbi:translocating chain-associated membrane protein 2 isoform X3 [Macaca fascicularis]|uniref:translocating chain-associated membrane protein 2 isoform X3 n=1 Tax=Macaca fascicularis TaxID=9541 RepID=UPI003D15EE90